MTPRQRIEKLLADAPTPEFRALVGAVGKRFLDGDEGKDRFSGTPVSQPRSYGT